MARPKRHKPQQPTVPDAEPFVDRLLWWILVAGVIVIPCVVQPTGQESFRFPKLLLFRAEGIVLLTIVGVAAIWGKFDFRRYDLRKPAVWLPLAIVGWTAITTAMSQKPLISLYSLLTVVSAFTMYLLTYALARSKHVRAAGVVLVPALVNALVYWLQKSKVWNPLVPDSWTLKASNAQRIQDLSNIALQGNRNDVGTFLLIPSLLAIVLAATAKGRLRVFYGGTAIILVSALVLSRTLTAMIALLFGIAALGSMRSWRAAVGTAIVTMLIAFLTLQYFPPLHDRMLLAKVQIHGKRYDEIFSGRLGAYLAAASMAVDHPLVGVGPGVFGREFLKYRIDVDKHWDSQGLRAFAVNFGEAHNDHLQVLDETGILGLLGLATAIALVVQISFRRYEVHDLADPRVEFARRAAFPFALSFAVLALAQFPLQIAATLVTYAFIFGLLEGWSEQS